MRASITEAGRLAPDHVQHRRSPRAARGNAAHLAGYLGSRPVRVGNAAYNHLQLDIYGELMDSVYLYDKYGPPITHEIWSNIERLLDWVCQHWREAETASGRCAAGGSSSTRG